MPEPAEKPTPGGSDSLNILFDNLHVVLNQLETECLLHVEMFNEDLFCQHLQRRLEDVYHSVHSVKENVWGRALQVMSL